MFQSSRERKRADDQPICVNCKKEENCEFRPDRRKPDEQIPGWWRFVLSYCQRFEGKNGETIDMMGNITR